MKPFLPIGIVIAAVIALSAETLEVQLQRAIQKESASGDLKAAIDTYKKIAASAGTNRAVAAQALLHEAEAHQKLGDAEAQRLYQQIVRQYADQKDAAAAAQSRLGGATIRTGGTVNRRVWDSRNATAVSPDGRYIAFTDWDNKDHNDLVLHDLSTGADRRLTRASADEYADEAAFSPDGKQIAYVWYTKNSSDLRIISLTGNGTGSPRVFKDGNWNYDVIAWSPDGKWLATVRWVKDIVPGGKVVLVSAEDGSSRVLADAYVTQVIFSPDSRYLAYDRGGPVSQHDVFIADIASSRETPAIVWPSDERIMGWAKDGRLLFASDRSGSVGLWAQQFIDGKPQGQPTLIKADIGTGGSLGMTSSGSLYYYVSGRGSQQYLEIAPFDFGTGRVTSPAAANGRAAQMARVLEQYDWSPDGKYLAYVTPDAAFGRRGPAIVIQSIETGVTRIIAHEDVRLSAQFRWAPDSRTLLVGGLGEVFLVDSQTERVSTFKADPARGLQGVFYQPRWSPDQKKIYFEAGIQGQRAFFESDPDLKNVREILRRATVGGLNLTPDGRMIITPLVTSPGIGALAAVPVAGGAPREYFSGPSRGNIFMSPDGKYIALVSATPSTLKLTSASIVPTAGGEVRELFSVQPPLVVGMGMWAPDSKSIFVRTIGPDGQQVAMWRLPVEGGQPVKVDTGLNLDQFTRFITASPAGHQIAYVRGSGTPAEAGVWALENFLPALK